MTEIRRGAVVLWALMIIVLLGRAIMDVNSRMEVLWRVMTEMVGRANVLLGVIMVGRAIVLWTVGLLGMTVRSLLQL